jgi:hypothetical protein
LFGHLKCYIAKPKHKHTILLPNLKYWPFRKSYAPVPAATGRPQPPPPSLVLRTSSRPTSPASLSFRPASSDVSTPLPTATTGGGKIKSIVGGLGNNHIDIWTSIILTNGWLVVTVYDLLNFNIVANPECLSMIPTGSKMYRIPRIWFRNLDL